MNTYKLTIMTYKREQRFHKWRHIDNDFDLVSEIKGFSSATQTLRDELHKQNAKCFNSKGEVLLGSRQKYNYVGYVRNESETTMYKLEIVRTH